MSSAWEDYYDDIDRENEWKYGRRISCRYCGLNKCRDRVSDVCDSCKSEKARLEKMMADIRKDGAP